jgi:RNA polymerase sigma-70 factor (ECF subfamily)
MTENNFAEIINASKGIVLSAVSKHLSENYYMVIDDVVQETYLRAYKSISKNGFRGDSAINTWLYTIAKNESLRMNEKLDREEKKFSRSVEKFIPEMDEKNDHKENIEELYSNIMKLPAGYMRVMKLVAEGYSEKEIALKLGIKQGTVKSRASRGREILKKIYEKGNGHEK